MAASLTDTWRQNVGPHARWYHRTIDTKANVAVDGYFDVFSDEMEVGDVIEVAYDTDGTPGGTHYVVDAITAAGQVQLKEFDLV